AHRRRDDAVGQSQHQLVHGARRGGGGTQLLPFHPASVAPAAAHHPGNRMSWWVMAFFLIAGLLGMPLAFALGAAAIGGLWMSNVDFNRLPQRMMAAVNSFPLMAIPLFMVAGELMIKGGTMEQMVACSNALVGRVRGGLAQVAMPAGAILSLVSGTAVSDAAALSSTLGPELKKKYGLG